MDDWMQKLQSVLSDADSMQELGELAQMLKEGLADTGGDTGSGAPQPEPAAAAEASGGPDLDFGKLLQIGQLLSSTGTDQNAALLLALRPHLGKERQEKIDRAVKLLKLYTVWMALKDSGMLEDLL